MADQVDTRPGTDRDELFLLVDRFAEALKLKLLEAERKHGWNGAWKRPDWREELRTELVRHVDKGDPLDVAAYAAFAWYHGWSTAPGNGRRNWG